MIAHDHIDTELLRPRNLPMAGCSAVSRHQDLRTLAGQLLNSRCIQAVSFAGSMRDIQPRVHADFSQEQEKLRAAGHAINVIVSPDTHTFASLAGVEQTVCRAPHIREEHGRAETRAQGRR